MVQQSAEGVATRDQLERMVELFGAYSSAVLTERLIGEATDGELTPAQFDTMAFVHRHGGCSAKALSEGLRISIPSATRLVDRLVRKKLIARREGDVDRRLVHLSLTMEGEQAVQAVHEARIARMHLALHSLPLADRGRLLVLLERFMLAALRDESTVQDCCRHCGTDHESTCVVNEAHQVLVGRPIAHP